jgi:nitrogen fixation/metabolism regulation signal transduction histidine kinase
MKVASSVPGIGTAAAVLTTVERTADAEARREIADLLRRERETIADSWERLVREFLPPLSNRSAETVRDEIPQLVQLLADRLEKEGAAEGAFRTVAAKHAGQRLQEDLQPVDLVVEYQLLRRAILDHLMARGAVRWEIVTDIAEALDGALTVTMAHFFRLRERRLQSTEARAERYRASYLAFMETVLDQLPMAAAVAEAPSGRIAHANRAFHQLHPDPLAGSTDEYAHHGVHRLDGTPCPLDELPLVQALGGEVTGPTGLRLLDAGGRWIDVEVRAQPIRGADGAILGAVVLVDDVSERRRLERERDLFIGALGHDLRNPLQTIKLGAEMLIHDVELSPRSGRIARRLASSATRMASLIDDLLDFARSRFDGFTLSPGEMDLADACSHVIEDLALLYPDRSVEFERRGRTRGSWDRARLEQLVANLVKNALVHGEPSAPVRVRLRGEDDRVVLEVANRGTGIPPEDQERIFEPFQHGEGGGVGLGLYIARSIAQAHGGTLELESDGITVFRLTLARAP